MSVATTLCRISLISCGLASLIRILFCLDVKPERMSTLFLKSLVSSLISSLLTLPLTGVSLQCTRSSFCSICILNSFDCGLTYRSRMVPSEVFAIFTVVVSALYCSIRLIGALAKHCGVAW